MKSYQEEITDIAKEMGRPEVDPRHVEAYMRVGHSTLDGLARWQFVEEVEICIACIDAGGLEDAERTARSFAL